MHPNKTGGKIVNGHSDNWSINDTRHLAARPSPEGHNSFTKGFSAIGENRSRWSSVPWFSSLHRLIRHKEGWRGDQNTSRDGLQVIWGMTGTQTKRTQILYHVSDNDGMLVSISESCKTNDHLKPEALAVDVDDKNVLCRFDKLAAMGIVQYHGLELYLSLTNSSRCVQLWLSFVRYRQMTHQIA